MERPGGAPALPLSERAFTTTDRAPSDFLAASRLYRSGGLPKAAAEMTGGEGGGQEENPIGEDMDEGGSGEQGKVGGLRLRAPKYL